MDAGDEGHELSVRRPPPTLPMRRALAGAVVLFGLIVTTQVILHLSALVLAVLAAGATEVLLHTGGLDSKTFADSLYASLVLLLVLGGAAYLRARARRGTESTADRNPVAGLHRDPAATVARVLLVSLIAVALLGWHRSPFFPYPLATIVVLANLYFFSAYGPAWIGRGAIRLTRRLFAFGARSQWTAGATTIGLLILSIAAVCSAKVELGFLTDAARQARESGRFEELDKPASFAERNLESLCLVGDAVDPTLAEDGSDANGCRFLTAHAHGSGGGSWRNGGWGKGGGRPDDECTETLAGEGAFVRVQGVLNRSYGLNQYDAQDLAMWALLTTCAMDPLPDNPPAYFATIATRAAPRFAERAARFVSCDEGAFDTIACVETDAPDISSDKLDALWERAECSLGTRVMRVIRLRLHDGLSFAEIGEKLLMTEVKARDTYNNAIKKLHRLGVADCFRE